VELVEEMWVTSNFSANTQARELLLCG